MKYVNDAKRKAQQAVALYEQLVKNHAQPNEIRSAYSTAKDLVDNYGMELDYYETRSGFPTNYTDYYSLVGRLDLTLAEYMRYFN